MKKILSSILFITFLAVTVLYFNGCSQDSLVSNNTPENKPSDIVSIGGNGNSVILYAGQTINAGTVSFDDIDTDNDGNDDLLRVTYNTINGWQIMETHFFVGNTLEQLPTTKSGNPIPGQFPYKSGSLNGLTTYSFDIPFSVLGMNCPGGPFSKVFAAHASLRKSVNGTWQNETGWADGPRINTRGSWAEYNNFTLTCDEFIPPQECNDTETAFAYNAANAHCFSEYGSLLNNETRWGWSNGSLAPSATPYTFSIYAGAGQCNLSNGELVGTLTVLYNNGSAVVTWNLTAGNEGKEFHLYVGNDPLPKNKKGEYTIAPGQYPIVLEVPTGESLSTYSYTVNNLTGNIYVIAHASVKDC